LKVDPNTAPWWELTVLPGVGEVTAKRIVDYRDTRRCELAVPDDAPVFRSAADLQQVKGIGPKKSKGMESYLVFEATAGRTDPSSAPPARTITQTTERPRSPG
jgi:DNA uptake protein ComE-like DNA-binding protein